MAVPRLLLIDNYDSFTYNLVQAFLMLGAEVDVYRNDALSVAQAQALEPTHLCISPGPGTPQQAGVSIEMIRAFAGRIPVLGVCLGHQSIVECFGGRVVRAARLAKLAIGAMSLSLKRPEPQPKTLADSLSLHVVRVWEPDPPQGEEPAKLAWRNTSPRRSLPWLCRIATMP